MPEKYPGLLKDPETPYRYLLGGNVHEKLKKISEESKPVKQASSVLWKNNDNNLLLFTEQESEEWEGPQKYCAQEHITKECQLPNQVQGEERKLLDLPQTRGLMFFQIG